ncbi:hypothetical protein B0H13DRAFT_2286495 [Mycena leptocephala]|nr:hypothetical protein B0H13DRAFT_2286495 [Mycena leptocephala]
MHWRSPLRPTATTSALPNGKTVIVLGASLASAQAQALKPSHRTRLSSSYSDFFGLFGITPHSITLSCAVHELGVEKDGVLGFDYAVSTCTSHLDANGDAPRYANGINGKPAILHAPYGGTRAEGIAWLKRKQRVVEDAAPVLVVGARGGALGSRTVKTTGMEGNWEGGGGSSFQPNDAQHLSPARAVLVYFTYVWSGTDEDRRVRVRVRGKREERHGRTTRRSTRASSSSIPPEGWEGWGRSAAVHGRGSEPPARRRPPRTRRPARAVLDPRARAVEGGPPSVAAHARGTTTSVAAREGATSSPRARARPRPSEWAGENGEGDAARDYSCAILGCGCGANGGRRSRTSGAGAGSVPADGQSTGEEDAEKSARARLRCRHGRWTKTLTRTAHALAPAPAPAPAPADTTDHTNAQADRNAQDDDASLLAAALAEIELLDAASSDLDLDSDGVRL